MMYTRASASDYDDWETVYGNKGWGSKELIPFLKKVHLSITQFLYQLTNFHRSRRTKFPRGRMRRTGTRDP